MLMRIGYERAGVGLYRPLGGPLRHCQRDIDDRAKTSLWYRRLIIVIDDEVINNVTTSPQSQEGHFR